MDKRVLILSSYTLTSRPPETNRFNKAGDEELLDYLASQLTREPGPFALSSYVPASGLHLIAANLPAETRVLETPSIEEFRESLNPQQRFIMCCETARIVTTWSLFHCSDS